MEEPQVQTVKKDKKGLKVTVIILSIIALSLGGLSAYLLFGKSSTNDLAQQGGANNENTAGIIEISKEAFENDKVYYLDDKISEDNLKIISMINLRYPEYKYISAVSNSMGHLNRIINNNGYESGEALFNGIGNLSESAEIAYLFGAMFGSFNNINADVADETIKAIFGIDNPRQAITSKGVAIDDREFYSMPSAQLGGACFPMTFLTSITKSAQRETILEYNYAEAQGGGFGCGYYQVTNKLKFTLGSNGSTEIQIKLVEVVK